MRKIFQHIIRYNEAINILHKVVGQRESSFAYIVSAMKPLRHRTYEKEEQKGFENRYKSCVDKNIGYIVKEKFHKTKN